MFNVSMDVSQVSIIFSIVVLAVVVTSCNKPKKELSKLAALAFTFIIAGIILWENRLVGYSLQGIGVLLSLIDI